MRVPLRSRWAIGFAVVGVVVLVACGVASSGALSGGPQSQPSRSTGNKLVSISDAAANPCAYLTTAEQHQLLVYPGQQTRGADGAGGPSCEWRTIPATEGVGYLARMLHGPVPAGRPAASIYNMPTVEYTPADLDPRTNCVYLLTVTPNDTLWVQYGNTSGSLPGLNHQVACRKAQAAAADMANTIRRVPM